MDRRTFSRNSAVVALAATLSGYKPLLHAEGNFGDRDATPEVPFKLSVMLWTVFRDLPFEERLEKVAAAGYKNVELVGEYQKWSEEDDTEPTPSARNFGISFDATAGIKRSLTNPADRRRDAGGFREALASMEKLDCPSIILLSGNVVPGMSRDDQHQSCIDGLKAAAKLVEGKKIAGEPVRLLLETIDPIENPKYYLTSATEAFDIVKAVNHPQVWFLYDFFHEQIAEGNLVEKLEKNIEHVALVHIADVPGRHEPGTGEINYGSIFRKLGQLKYRGTIAMEFLPTGDPVAQLRAAREMAVREALGK